MIKNILHEGRIPRSAGRGAGILIVEDESIIAMDLSNSLRNLGFTVKGIAYTGEEAISMTSSLRPDLLLMDIQLNGEMDGITAVRNIRQISDVPVIYLTAHTNEFTFLRAIETGPYGYLLKPVGKNDLYTSIETALHRRELEYSLQESETRYRGLVETLPQAIVEHDPSGIITFCNSSFSQLTGYHASDLVGRSINSLVQSGIVREEGFQLTLFPEEPPSSYQASARILHKDGTIRNVHIDGNRRINEGEGKTGYLTVLTEYPDAKHYNDAPDATRRSKKQQSRNFLPEIH